MNSPNYRTNQCQKWCSDVLTVQAKTLMGRRLNPWVWFSASRIWKLNNQLDSAYVAAQKLQLGTKIAKGTVSVVDFMFDHSALDISFISKLPTRLWTRICC